MVLRCGSLRSFGARVLSTGERLGLINCFSVVVPSEHVGRLRGPSIEIERSWYNMIETAIKIIGYVS